MDRLFPTEIITNILGYMPIDDLARLERTCRLFQSYALYEIERRIIKPSSTQDEWGVLIHLGQAVAHPTRFDCKTKKAYYSITMDPVKVKTMFDHRRSIHCSLLRKKCNKYQTFNNGEDSFVITVEKGMEEGKTVELNIENKSCQVHATLTRLPIISHPNDELLQELKKEFKSSPHPIKSMAPDPLTYTLQITELTLPLSTIALA
ncbi:MAG: hypothetical protein EXX96DRAFT_516570 [Benjaminiella poitrasii]|nr:MAG: hypothetical protein EXX96DRAFT_516570 [Benjaminiella poitrasii]